METQEMSNTPTRGSRRRLAAVTLMLATAGAALVGSSAASRAATTCSQASLSPSTFESDGTLVAQSGCINWGTPAPNLSTGVDLPSGSTDNAFGQGTHENDTSASVVLGSIPPNKNDLTRFYLADEFVNNMPFLYLAWERAVNIGSADMDFEINQAAQPALRTAGMYTLNRTVGDLLVLFEFGGSGTPMIQIATWQGTAWSTPVTLNGTSALASVNTGTVTDPLNGNASLTTGLFGDAAINLQAAGIFNSNLCENFSSAYVKARSSGSSFNAELKDLISPIPVNLHSCVTPTVTTSQTPTTGTVGSTSFTDSATVTGVTGSVANESVTFKLFGPSPASGFDCSPTAGALFTTTGTLTQAGSTASTMQTAGSKVLSAVGSYYWVAYYPGDRPGGQNLPAQSGCTDEPITVGKAPASVSTVATNPQGGISVGSTVGISDTATLSSAFQPTGSVSFGLHGPISGTATASSCTAANLVALPGNPIAGSVTAGGTATTGSQSFTPTQAGMYYWVAGYSGDNNNQGAGPSGCGDPNESVVVSTINPTLASKILLSDSAKVSGASGAGTPTGSVVFELFNTADCSSTPIFTSTSTTLDAGGTASTTSPVAATPAGTYAWEVVFTSTNANYNGLTTPCTAEQAVISYRSPSPAP